MKQQNSESGKKLSVPLLQVPVCKQQQIGVTRQCTPRLPLNVEKGESHDKGNRVREALQPLEVWVADGCDDLDWFVNHY